MRPSVKKQSWRTCAICLRVGIGISVPESVIVHHCFPCFENWHEKKTSSVLCSFWGGVESNHEINTAGGSGTHVLCCSVMANSLWPHGPYPARLLCPWDFPAENTRVGCHFLLQGNLPDPGIELASRVSCLGRQIFFFFFLTTSTTGEAI